MEKVQENHLHQAYINYPWHYFFVNAIMDTRTLNNGDDNREVTLTIQVNVPDYAPAWLNIRHRITATTFTAAVKKADFPRLEADQLVNSFSINEELD